MLFSQIQQAPGPNFRKVEKSLFVCNTRQSGINFSLLVFLLSDENVDNQSSNFSQDSESELSSASQSMK